jgi:hypothetical protein
MNIMKNGALFLLIILISGLILAPFLGGAFDAAPLQRASFLQAVFRLLAFAAFLRRALS